MQDNIILGLFHSEIDHLNKDDRFLRIKNAVESKLVSLTYAAKIYGVSKSGYCSWIKRTGGHVMPKNKYKDLDPIVEEIFHKHNGNYGRPRIKIELANKYGWVVDERTVGASLKRLGLKAGNGKNKRQKEYKNTAFSESDKIRRNFKAVYFGQKIYTDVSQFNTWVKSKSGTYIKKAMYVSASVDGWSHEIIDFTVTDNKSGFSFVYDNIASTMDKVNKIKGKNKYTIIHTDHGTDYTTREYYLLSKKYNFIKSMSRSGVTYDNAVIERIWKVIKGEFWKKLPRDEQTPEGLEKGLKNYIDYYNNVRINVKFKCSPVAHRDFNERFSSSLTTDENGDNIKEVFLGGEMNLPEYKTPQKIKFIKDEMK